MMDKIKTLPSSYREKKRYIIFKIISDEPVSFEELVKAVWRSSINLLGILGVAKTNLRVFPELYDAKKKIFVVRCLPKDVELIRLSVALITEINKKSVCIYSLGVAGTLKSVKTKYYL
ncbi:MAG: ribonuclease P protein component 2 [Candidatus Aenigmarchaeota archaeon ex4484_56]|nr:MAG: ribonuclease P protein component 2 [Candidatus Aenigmarchaeota archaeon ex4484_56]